MYSTSTDKVEITSCTFEQNEALVGGAVYITTTPEIPVNNINTISGSTFS